MEYNIINMLAVFFQFYHHRFDENMQEKVPRINFVNQIVEAFLFIIAVIFFSLSD